MSVTGRSGTGAGRQRTRFVGDPEELPGQSQSVATVAPMIAGPMGT